jgi:hypothetical protein
MGAPGPREPEGPEQSGGPEWTGFLQRSGCEEPAPQAGKNLPATVSRRPGAPIGPTPRAGKWARDITKDGAKSARAPLRHQSAAFRARVSNISSQVSRMKSGHYSARLLNQSATDIVRYDTALFHTCNRTTRPQGTA